MTAPDVAELGRRAVEVDEGPHMFGIEHDDGGAYHDGKCWTLDRWPLMWRVDKRGAVHMLDLTGDGWDRSALVEGPQGLWTGTVTPRVPA